MGWARALAPGQECRIRIVEIETGAIRTVWSSADVLFEAPNWTREDELIVNGDGKLWRLPVAGGVAPAVIALGGVPELNNDHVLAPDHRTVFLSGNDGHLYEASVGGGAARRVTRSIDDGWHFLHGVSPDGDTLAYVSLDPFGTDAWTGAHVRTVCIDGSDDRRVTAGGGPDDGPEFSPDGAWLYFNTERFSATPGHAQLARIRPDGSLLEQLTFDERVNWFPHIAPSGRDAVYLSYPQGVEGHPADLEVELRLVRDGRWQESTVLVELCGGQGTINVNSWSPDGSQLAFVEYPRRGVTGNSAARQEPSA